MMIHDAKQALGDTQREITLGADKGYDAEEFIAACLEMKVTPHVAQNKSGRKSAVPETIAQSGVYAISQQKRKLIEQGFGWAKTIGGMRQVMVRGVKKVDQLFVLTMAAYNLVRMRTLGQIRPQLRNEQNSGEKPPGTGSKQGKSGKNFRMKAIQHEVHASDSVSPRAVRYFSGLLGEVNISTRCPSASQAAAISLL
jgi:hypothetical protein